VIEQLVDDLDGSPVAETVSFGLDGVGFDLNEQHAADPRAGLDPYVQAVRRVRGQRGGGAGAAAPSWEP
jgi:hypothetical protein